MIEPSHLSRRVLIALVVLLSVSAGSLHATESDDVSMFVFLAIALASDDHSNYAGEWHPVILYATGASEESAIRSIKKFLSDQHWDEFVVKKTTILDLDADLPEDRDQRKAFRQAQKTGVAMVVYTERTDPPGIGTEKGETRPNTYKAPGYQ